MFPLTAATVGSLLANATGRPDLAVAAQWLFIVIAEVIVVIVEWRLLVWALRADSRTWLLRSVAMNATSFALGSWLLAVVLGSLSR